MQEFQRTGKRSMLKRIWSLALTFMVVFSAMTSLAGLAASAEENTPVTIVGWSFNRTLWINTYPNPNGAAANNPEAIPANVGINTEGSELRGNSGNINLSYLGSDQSDGTIINRGWSQPGACWLMTFSTKDFMNLTVSLHQRSSGSGPRDFKFEYSLDGTEWKPVTDQEVDAVVPAISVMIQPGSGNVKTVDDLALPAELDNRDVVYLRLRVVSDVRADGNVGGMGVGAAESGINHIVIMGVDYVAQPELVSLSVVPSSTNLQNNTTITIAVTGNYSNDTSVVLASALVKLKQNGTQTVKVGDYDVTVVVNGNNKITNCYIGAQVNNGNQNSQGQNSNSQGGNSQR